MGSRSALALVAALLAGCGSADEAPTPPPPSRPTIRVIPLPVCITKHEVVPCPTDEAT